MKTFPSALLVLLAVFAFTKPACAQGPLGPPGSPAPTMKMLDQVEPRVIVNATNTPGNGTNTFIISAAGSYYLTGNITGAAGKHGISIQADDVTLDLNGFALISGGGGATRGVNVPAAQTNLCIRNGGVRGWTDGGVRADPATILAEKLLLANNVGATGLSVGNGSLVRDCVSNGNATGFIAGDRTQLIGCISTVNSGHGFSCTSYVNLVDCSASRNGLAIGSGFVVQGGCSLVRCSATRNGLGGGGQGIEATGSGCTISDCTATNNNNAGIIADTGATVRGCTSSSNGNIGIYVGSINGTGRSHVYGNMCHANVGSGIYVGGDGSRIEDNNVTYNQYGIQVAGTHNIIVRNTARGSGVINFGIFGSFNAVGTIFDVSAGGTISTTEPWCNFSF